MPNTMSRKVAKGARKKSKKHPKMPPSKIPTLSWNIDYGSDDNNASSGGSDIDMNEEIQKLREERRARLDPRRMHKDWKVNEWRHNNNWATLAKVLGKHATVNNIEFS